MSKRSFVVALAEAGQPLAAVLRKRLKMTLATATGLIRERRVRLAGSPCADPERRVAPGQRVEVVNVGNGKGQGDIPRFAPVVRFADAHIVVVDKPAGLTTMRHPDEAAEFGPRGRRFLPPTLADLLPGLLSPGGRGPRIRAVHRIDKETSGLVVFARTPVAESHLGKQFRAHTVERRYLAMVRGQAAPGRIESSLVRDRGDGRRGTGVGEGQQAITHVRVVEELGAFTLVECRLETGRTHQVRVHLGERGTPLCGERVYDRPLHGQPVADDSGAKRPMLHAARLGVAHPATGERLAWEAAMPDDMATLLKRLRGGAGK